MITAERFGLSFVVDKQTPHRKVFTPSLMRDVPERLSATHDMSVDI
ncbi:hypothetical protein QWZ16_14480 [Vibrio ostreicida]|uniref:Uncharacterized protein n=1 Tax=Vibrio ostreicida TaxID=526588 RepID=A0ABT8BUQ8_9VIBR|nr:hypothetical protein [Vibrio ostreicida]MDN3610901.1 hypothetical protein [Vibrio ostreicida]